MATTARQQAILTLLKPPAVRYLYGLKESLDRDPDYLLDHENDVGNIVIGFLTGAGFQWHREILEKEWSGILKEALVRLTETNR